MSPFLSADCEESLCWWIWIQINSPFPHLSATLWALDGAYVLFKRCMPHYTGYFQASLWSTHLFHYVFSTVSNRQCKMLPLFHLSDLMYTCINYCNILLQGLSYPAWLLPRSTPTNHRNQGSSWKWNKKQNHNTVSGHMPNFHTGGSLKIQENTSLSSLLISKYIFLCSTILAVFGPFNPLTSVRKLQSQLKFEPSCSAHHHMPAGLWDVAFSCPAAFLLSCNHVRDVCIKCSWLSSSAPLFAKALLKAKVHDEKVKQWKVTLFV